MKKICFFRVFGSSWIGDMLFFITTLKKKKGRGHSGLDLVQLT